MFHEAAFFHIRPHGLVVEGLESDVVLVREIVALCECQPPDGNCQNLRRIHPAHAIGYSSVGGYSVMCRSHQVDPWDLGHELNQRKHIYWLGQHHILLTDVHEVGRGFSHGIFKVDAQTHSFGGDSVINALETGLRHTNYF